MIIYDVALSFAGEDREYVEKIAYLLKAHGIKVFYDKFETSKLLGRDLFQFLNDTYKNKARYCMIFISSNYIKKKWSKHELKSAQARSFECDEDYILPIYLEDVNAPGLNKTIGALYSNEYTVEEIVEIVEEKIDNNINKIDIYNVLVDYIQNLTLSYIVIGGNDEIFFFQKAKDSLKSFLLTNVFNLNRDIYLSCCSLIDGVEQRFAERMEQELSTEENVKKNLAYAVNLYSRSEKLIRIIEYYIEKNFDDNIDFFQVGEKMRLFEEDSQEKLQELVEKIMLILQMYDEE